MNIYEEYLQGENLGTQVEENVPTLPVDEVEKDIKEMVELEAAHAIITAEAFKEDARVESVMAVIQGEKLTDKELAMAIKVASAAGVDAELLQGEGVGDWLVSKMASFSATVGKYTSVTTKWMSKLNTFLGAFEKTRIEQLKRIEKANEKSIIEVDKETVSNIMKIAGNITALAGITVVLGYSGVYKPLLTEMGIASGTPGMFAAHVGLATIWQSILGRFKLNNTTLRLLRFNKDVLAVEKAVASKAGNSEAQYKELTKHLNTSGLLNNFVQATKTTKDDKYTIEYSVHHVGANVFTVMAKKMNSKGEVAGVLEVGTTSKINAFSIKESATTVKEANLDLAGLKEELSVSRADRRKEIEKLHKEYKAKLDEGLAKGKKATSDAVAGQTKIAYLTIANRIFSDMKNRQEKFRDAIAIAKQIQVG